MIDTREFRPFRFHLSASADDSNVHDVVCRELRRIFQTADLKLSDTTIRQFLALCLESGSIPEGASDERGFIEIVTISKLATAQKEHYPVLRVGPFCINVSYLSGEGAVDIFVTVKTWMESERGWIYARIFFEQFGITGLRAHLAELPVFDDSDLEIVLDVYGTSPNQIFLHASRVEKRDVLLQLQEDERRRYV